MNERSVLEHIRRGGPLSRAQISRRSGLSKPTVSQALGALERADLAVPRTLTQHRSGRLFQESNVDIGRFFVG